MKWLGIYFATVLYGVKIISKRIFLCMCILKYFSKYGFAHFEHPFYVSKIKNRETQIDKIFDKCPLDRSEYRYYTHKCNEDRISMRFLQKFRLEINKKTNFLFL